MPTTLHIAEVMCTRIARFSLTPHDRVVGFSMSRIILIVVPTVCYFGQAAVCWWTSDRPHAVIWASYASANLGFIWYEYTRTID